MIVDYWRNANRYSTHKLKSLLTEDGRLRYCMEIEKVLDGRLSWSISVHQVDSWKEVRLFYRRARKARVPLSRLVLSMLQVLRTGKELEIRTMTKSPIATILKIARSLEGYRSWVSRGEYHVVLSFKSKKARKDAETSFHEAGFSARHAGSIYEDDLRVSWREP